MCRCGPVEGYANRDSLAYEAIYGLDGIQNLVRAPCAETDSAADGTPFFNWD